MKQILFILVIAFTTISLSAQQKKPDFSKQDPTKKTQAVEVACGECKFKMKGDGCHLAVRIKGKSYWVDNADVDAFGDAHDKKGFCKAIRKADVQGEVMKNNRFELTYLKFTK